MAIGPRIRFAVDAHYLLTPGVRHSRENSGFGDSGKVLVFKDAGDRNAFVAKTAEQQASGLVVANNADRKNVHAEIGKVVDRIGSAARDHRTFAVTEDEHGGFARNP